MNFKIVDVPETVVAGMEYSGLNANQEIVDLWKVFMERYQEIDSINPHIMYGLCYDSCPSGEFSYLAAVEVKEPEVLPTGMKLMKIPERSYAVFTFKDHLSKLSDFWTQIYTEYLPANKLASDINFSYELYDERYSKNGEIDIYIPVK